MSVSTLRLYEIADHYLQALEALGEIEDLPPEAIADTLEGLSGTFEDKAVNVGAYIRTLEAEASSIEDARKSMERRQQSLKRHAGRLKDYLKRQMERPGLTKVKNHYLLSECKLIRRASLSRTRRESRSATSRRRSWLSSCAARSPEASFSFRRWDEPNCKALAITCYAACEAQVSMHADLFLILSRGDLPMKAFTFTKPARLPAAMPLIFGLATVVAVPAAQAAQPELVDIVDGAVDRFQNGVINQFDDLVNVWLWCNDATPVRVRVVDGGLDVTENGVVDNNDDLVNCDLNDEDPIGGEDVPTTDQVDIINGRVDVNEDGVGNGNDDVFFVKLFID